MRQYRAIKLERFFNQSFNPPMRVNSALAVSTMTMLRDIVTDYIRCYRESAEQEQRWFAIQRTLEEAVSRAALAVSPSGKRLSHQRRIPQAVLAESKRRLLASLSAIAQAKSFEELHETVAAAIQPISGIGELTIYDTALRIGAKLKLEPNVVFLHAGTRAGAKRLGLGVSREFIPMAQFPRAFQRLRPREVEDVLCIYKAQLGGYSALGLSNGGCYGTANPAVNRTCAKSRAGRLL